MHLPDRLLFIACASAAPAAHAQSSVPAVPDVGTSLVQIVLALGVVIAVLIAALWLVKRLAAPRGAASGMLRIIAGAAVGPRERVVVLEVGDTWIVLGVAPGRVNTLHRLRRQSEVAAPAAPDARHFGTWLKQVMERRHAG